MTSSSEQPKEYIITEEQLHNLVHGNAQLCLVMEKEVRSRQHPAPALPLETCPICDIAVPCDRRFGSNGYPSCVERAMTEAARKAREDENDRVLTSLVQELAGTWRMRDQKLFAIIRKYRLVPIGAMKNTTPHTE